MCHFFLMLKRYLGNYLGHFLAIIGLIIPSSGIHTWGEALGYPPPPPPNISSPPPPNISSPPPKKKKKKTPKEIILKSNSKINSNLVLQLMFMRFVKSSFLKKVTPHPNPPLCSCSMYSEILNISTTLAIYPQ